MKFEKTALEGLCLIQPFYEPDNRGFFTKSFERNAFCKAGIHINVWETFYTHSRKGVLRGLHFQRCHSQDKLVQVLHGAVYDVAVDLRLNSPTFGRWEGFYMTGENRRLLYLPKGFAHGFLALEETLFSYLCGNRYDPASDGGILWSDPELAVRWPLEKVERVIVSEKDAALPSLAAFRAQYGGLSDGENAPCGS